MLLTKKDDEAVGLKCVSFVVISSIPNQTSLAGKMFYSKLIPQSAFWQTLTNRNLLASIGWRNKILTYVFGEFLFDLICNQFNYAFMLPLRRVLHCINT